MNIIRIFIKETNYQYEESKFKIDSWINSFGSLGNDKYFRNQKRK